LWSDHRTATQAVGTPPLGETEDEEGVRRVAEGEHDDRQQHPPRGGPELPPAGERERGAGLPRPGGRLAHRGEEDHHHRRRRERGAQEDLLEGEPGEPQQGRRHQRADHRAEVVHAAVEAVGGAALLGRHHVGDEGVARRPAHPLAETVGEAQHEHHRPRPGEGDQRPGGAGQEVAEAHEREATRGPVRPHPRHQLERGGGRLGDPLDQAERDGARAEDRGQEERQQGVDHLAADVGQQADQAEGDDGARQALHPGESGTGHGALQPM
jgi:hypothetical protein